MALKGIKVIEMAGLAPGPMCGMILADFGASVIRIDKISSGELDKLGSGKRTISLNLKSKKGVEIFKKISNESDVIIDTYRKGVMEKLKLGPNDLMPTNEKLIYARLTGYGQDGPYSRMAGHDINYLGLSGLLSLFGRHNEKPTPPINFAADFAGGGLMCAMGVVLALYERNFSKRGQIVDTSMVRGAAYVGSWFYRSKNIPGIWGQPRGKNMLDTGSHFYDTYETKDGKFLAVGAIEPQFYDVLLQKLQLTDEELPQFDCFEENREKLSKIFKTKSQDEWCEVFDGSDACVTPILSLDDVKNHVHNQAQDTFIDSKDNEIVPKPEPRLSHTPGISCASKTSNPRPGDHTIEILREFGYSSREIDELLIDGVVKQSSSKSKL